MGFGIGDVVKTVATGGLNLAYDALKPSKQTTSQVPLETKEQKEARKLLLDFAKKGVFGNYTAGADLNLPGYSYDLSEAEQGGMSALRNLIASSIPSEVNLGGDALRDLTDTSEANIERMFNPFKTSTERLLRESEDSVKRSAGFAGNLYSTDTIGRLGDVRARGNELLTERLASLTNEALNRKLQAIPLAFESAKLKEALPLQRIQASQQYGGLERLLNTARQESERNEILRRRTELQQPIGALQSIIGTPVNFGVPSITTESPSTLMQILQPVAQLAGLFAGGRGAG